MSTNPTLFLAKAATIQGKIVTFLSDATVNITDGAYGYSTVASVARIDGERADILSLLSTEVDTINTNANNLETTVASNLSSASLSLDTKIAGEITRATNAENGLTSRIDTLLSNIDPAALDSLTEIVAAFKSMDGTLSADISTLSAAASSTNAGEVVRAQSVEEVLRIRISSEEVRAQAAEGVLTNNLSSEAITARAAEVVLTS